MTEASSGVSQWERIIARGRPAHHALLIGQVAVCSVFVVGAGLLSRSLAALHRVDTGVRTEDVLSVRLMSVPNGYEGFDAAS
jgi:hypothetical protein